MTYKKKRLLILTVVLMALAPVALAIPIADSESDFSLVQGQDNWFYGYMAPETSVDFIEMTINSGLWFGGEGWAVDREDYWTSMTAAWLHGHGPNASRGSEPIEHWAVRRWLSEVNGVIGSRVFWPRW